MEKVKLYFGSSQGKSFISRIIKWFQWGDPNTHTFYILDIDSVREGNPNVIEAWHKPLLRGGKVRKGKFLGNQGSHSEGTTYNVFSIEVSQAQKEYFEAFMLSKMDLKYDFKGFFGFASKNNSHSLEKYFCSEILFEGLQHIGIDLLNFTEAHQVEPSLFIKSPLLKLEKDLT